MRILPLMMSMVAAAALAGCASKRTAPPVMETPPPPPAASYDPPAPPPPAASTPPSQLAALQERFAAEAGERIYFELDSFTLDAEARAVLDRQAEWLNANPSLPVLIAGNCDDRGTREYNLALGARRAQAVVDHLTSRGVSPQRLRSISYGKERPIDGGADEQAWARNRNAHTMVGA